MDSRSAASSSCAAGSAVHVTSLQHAYDNRRIGDAVNLDRMLYQVDTQAEWHQIFADAWRWYNEFFYDQDMHGHDWKAIGDRYRASIPFLSSREELNWLISQMVGELCVGHTYITGGDMGPATTPGTPVYTGLLVLTWSPTRPRDATASRAHLRADRV